MSECCKTGFQWDGTPKGKETKLGDNNAYVTGDNSERAILLIHDIFGWTFNNLRLLSDKFASETKSTVYLADYFDGEIVDRSTMEDPEKRAKFDVAGFIGRNSKDKRGPVIHAHAKELKSKYKHVSAVGYCFGGWATFQLAAKDKNLLSAAVVAHPSLLSHEEIDGLSVPTLIIAPENDPSFNPELKEYANTKIPQLGIDYRYDFYPGVMHGFAVKGDPKNPQQKAALERASRSVINWLVEYTH